MKRRTVRALIATTVIAIVASFSSVQATTTEEELERDRREGSLVACRIAYINTGYVSICI